MNSNVAFFLTKVYVVITSGNHTPGSRFYSDLLDIPLFASTSLYTSVFQSARLLE